MPRKAVQKATETPVAEVKSSKPTKVTQPVVVDTTTVSDSTVPVKATRHVPTRETVEKEFNELVASIDEEISKLRDSTTKSKGVKFLRTVNKKVKTLRAHALRVSKQKQTTRRNNTNSGFLKPVQISEDLASFTGWDQKELRSRVDVTKFICNYIKEHDLQDPADRRNIRVENDPSLKKLLAFDGKDKKPLTYYSLQTYLKGHYLKSAPEPVTEVVAPKKGTSKRK